ncbi:A-kinase anchor protein 13 [Alosa sapidissima]|uniref:A-kinase anchor protein 13 n=1 Tax=Alosa sapidissima TaxID=34773 RepID=UPI001C0846C8|nr:A-kinase anchor protein 13 [Alosa sapidissima]
MVKQSPGEETQNLLLLLRRNSEQVLHSVTNLHDLLASLQAVVVQQDTFIEDQRQALSERPSSSASCSSSSASSRPSSRPNSLIEQERQRSLEKQRQEVATLQRQQAAHAEERRRRERQWEARESQLEEREAATRAREDELHRRRRELEQARLDLQARKEDYQRDLERLRDGQRRLDRDRDNLRRELETLEQLKQEKRMQRTPSSTSEDSLQFLSGGGSSLDLPEGGDSDLPRKNSLSRAEAKPKGRTLNPFSMNSGGSRGAERRGPQPDAQPPAPAHQEQGQEGQEEEEEQAPTGARLPAAPLDRAHH